jgi:methylated-DNA-protein-cysteine methyltransferase-like protein
MAKTKTKTATKPLVKKATKRAPAKPQSEKFERVFEQIYALVLQIPRGRVMTYGQIARLLDDRYSPRLVGWAMHAVPQDERHIPWHRVINSQGGISTGKIILHEPDLQRLLLENEEVIFTDKGRCDLSVYQWAPEKKKKRSSKPKERK